MRRPGPRPAKGEGVAGPRRSREPEHPLDCHERALRLLSVRPRSRHELGSRLLLAGFEAEAVREELDRLEAVGLLDDASFARAVAEHQVKVRHAGRRAVFSALAARGSTGGPSRRRSRRSAATRRCGPRLARERARRLAGHRPRRRTRGSWDSCSAGATTARSHVPRLGRRFRGPRKTTEAPPLRFRVLPAAGSRAASLHEATSDRSSSNRA